MFKLKRVYEEPSPEDGFRVLVERLWPRGVSKERAELDLWLKDVAPSPELRKWFSHDPAKWEAVPGALCRGTQGGQRGPALAEAEGEGGNRDAGVRLP